MCVHSARCSPNRVSESDGLPQDCHYNACLRIRKLNPGENISSLSRGTRSRRCCGLQTWPQPVSRHTQAAALCLWLLMCPGPSSPFSEPQCSCFKMKGSHLNCCRDLYNVKSERRGSSAPCECLRAGRQCQLLGPRELELVHPACVAE